MHKAKTIKCNKCPSKVKKTEKILILDFYLHACIYTQQEQPASSRLNISTYKIASLSKIQKNNSFKQYFSKKKPTNYT